MNWIGLWRLPATIPESLPRKPQPVRNDKSCMIATKRSAARSELPGRKAEMAFVGEALRRPKLGRPAELRGNSHRDSPGIPIRGWHASGMIKNSRQEAISLLSPVDAGGDHGKDGPGGVGVEGSQLLAKFTAPK